MITPREIELYIDNIDNLKALAGAAVRTLNGISNTLINADKWNISKDTAIELIRKYLQNFDVKLEDFEEEA